jgi:hypothetical protein
MFLACLMVEASWNVMAHAQKPDFVFRRNGRVHLNQRGRQFSRLMAAEVCASAVVILDTPCSEVVWRVMATHSIPQFPLHFPSRASPCAITFQLESTSPPFASNDWGNLRQICQDTRFKFLTAAETFVVFRVMRLCSLVPVTTNRSTAHFIDNSAPKLTP